MEKGIAVIFAVELTGDNQQEGLRASITFVRRQRQT